MLNLKRLEQVEEGYLRYLPVHFKDESFKWKAIQHFQKHWNIEADDFATMLDLSLAKTYSLLMSGFYYARSMIVGFAKEDPDGVRELFRMLYDESRNLSERVDRFIAYADDRKLNHNESGWKNHFQDTKSVSIYLWLRFPDKYYIYKYGECRPAAEILGSSFIPKRTVSVDNMIGSFQMCDEIHDHIIQNEAIISTFKSLLTDQCYPDPEFRTLSFDVVFYVSNFYRAEEWFPSDYTPGFSVHDWVGLLQNDEIFTKDSLIIMKRFLDIGGQATCTELAEKYGESKNYYNSGSTALAKRIVGATGCPVMPREIEDVRYWPILYLGKPATSQNNGSYIWRLRDELKQALEQIDLSGYPLYAKTDADGIRIWKISEGSNSTGVPENIKQDLEARKVVTVASLTKAKAGAAMTQGEQFMTGIHEGDYFYLCYASHVRLFGQFTTEEPAPNPEMNSVDDGQWYSDWFDMIIGSAFVREPFAKDFRKLIRLEDQRCLCKSI